MNFGIATAAEETYSTAFQRVLFRETATFGAEYNHPRGAEFDVGGGYMFTPVVGIGLSFTGTAHRGFPTLSVRIPHPNLFNASGRMWRQVIRSWIAQKEESTFKR